MSRPLISTVGYSMCFLSKSLKEENTDSQQKNLAVWTLNSFEEQFNDSKREDERRAE